MYLPRRPSAPTAAPVRRSASIGGNGRRRVRPAQLGAHDLAAGHLQRQAAADGFDFGKFGHGAIFLPDEHARDKANTL